jgi:hypothetical protein
MGVFCCSRDWCTSQNRWHLEERNLCGYINPLYCRGQYFDVWMEKVPILNCLFLRPRIYNMHIMIEMDRNHSKASKTVKILSLSITELILQAKTGGKSNQEVASILKAPCSISCLRSI